MQSDKEVFFQFQLLTVPSEEQLIIGTVTGGSAVAAMQGFCL